MTPKYYMVGGYVRDSLLGVTSHDVDFAVEAQSYEAMRQDLIDQGIRIFLENPLYFTIRGSHPVHGGVDYVLCRKDGQYIDGRHPKNVLAGTLLDDLKRRDFTINAMALDENGMIVDPFGGRVDIDCKLIRSVGDPDKRFQEDALRILRAIRFSLRFGFFIEPKTYESMGKYAHNVLFLPTERIREELDKCFRYHTLMTLEFLNDLGLTTGLFDRGSNLWLIPTNKGR